ncbi:MAG: ATP-binding protein [bacterium]|nr:ATP-binding protein [bacterium]
MEFIRKQAIKGNISPHRALIIYGPRRVGKTTVLQSYLNTAEAKNNYPRIFSSTGDDFTLRELFHSEKLKDIMDFARSYDCIAIDEAQFIPSIGLGSKMIIDAFPEKALILTGSSSFKLSEKIGEPLTGRHFTLTLLPLSQSEMRASRFELKNALSDFLIYGSYPEVLLEQDKKKKAKILTELVSSYLFKDVLALEKIKSPNLLLDVVKCLAFQIGNEVSLNEIARTVKTDVKTVDRYIDILEKMFVVKRVRGFSRNLRNEISKKAKYYFLDNGVRNAVIAQFNDLTLRNDVGALWENFIFMELIKKSSIEGSVDSLYFWRTHTGQEIDIVKESNGVLTAIECKWSAKNVVPPPLWTAAYPSASFLTLHKENYLEYFLP